MENLNVIIKELVKAHEPRPEVDDQLRNVVMNYYKESKNFLDQSPQDLEKIIAPYLKEIQTIDKKIATPITIEKIKTVAGVPCNVRDDKAIRKHYSSLQNKKDIINSKIKKIKQAYRMAEEKMVEELTEARSLKEQLKQQKLEYLAVLPLRALTKLVQSNDLYLLPRIKNGTIRVRCGYNDKEDADISQSQGDNWCLNENLFGLYPVAIGKAQYRKKMLLQEKKGLGYIFPPGFFMWVICWPFGLGCLALSGLSSIIIHSMTVFFPILGILTASWIAICTIYTILQYFIGYKLEIALPPAPLETQKRLLQWDNAGYKIRTIAEESAFQLTSGYSKEEVDPEPIFFIKDGKMAIIVEQYGVFDLEQNMIQQIKEMFTPETIAKGQFN